MQEGDWKKFGQEMEELQQVLRQWEESSPPVSP